MSIVETEGLSDAISSLVFGRAPENPYIPRTSPFVKMIVLEVIFDPNNDFNDDLKIEDWRFKGVVNIDFAKVLPRNTIVARMVGEQSNPMFVFPFFPSHLSLPCKPGEMVWTMLEQPDANLGANYLRAYWLCRVTEPHHVDDVNHTHAGRIFEPTLDLDTKDMYDGKKTILELRNGPVFDKNGVRTTSYEKNILPGESEDVFERLVTQTDASKLMSYESVPRYRKRPGDIALEGSNNALIVLGTDRADAAVEYNDALLEDVDEDLVLRTQIPKYPVNDYRDSAGSIDLVVGRGQTEETYGSAASTTVLNRSGNGVEIKKELNKKPSELSSSEGDVDLKNDRSRILISQRTRVDTRFETEFYNKFYNLGVEDSTPEGDSSIVIKSDKIRIIARSDIQFLVTSFTKETSPSGVEIKRENDDLSTWASVTIKSNGDIIFSPSEKGYIKLGDEGADKAILCTDIPAILVDGRATAQPIKTTGNAVVGANANGNFPSAGFGTFSTKVLVK